MSNPQPPVEGSAALVLWGKHADLGTAAYLAQWVHRPLTAGTLDEIRDDVPRRRSSGWRELVAVPEGSHPNGLATCGACGRSWDALRHPTPATLCPFCNGDALAAARHECYRFPTDEERSAMTDPTDLATDYAAALVDTMRTALAALDEGHELEGVPADEYLGEWPLEVVRQVGRRFEVVLTIGGPDARLVCDLDEDGDRWGPAAIEVTWGTSTATRHGLEVDRLADWYVEATA